MSNLSEALVAALERAAIDLPADHVRLLAQALALTAEPSASAQHRCAGLVPVDPFRKAVADIFQAWMAADPAPDGAALALALEVAAAAVGNLRREQRLDVVWTGPASYRVPVRQTGEVLLQVIRSATRSLIVISFAAYKVPTVIDEIRQVTGRGVDVRLVLETKEAGVLDFDAADAFSSLGTSVGIYEWPVEKRVAAGAGGAGGMPAMHVKAAIADDHTALITSANLTGSAVSRNMELGILIRGGPVPQRLADHFRQLMADGHLTSPSHPSSR